MYDYAGTYKVRTGRMEFSAKVKRLLAGTTALQQPPVHLSIKLEML